MVVALGPGSVDKPDAKVAMSTPMPNQPVDKGGTVTLNTVEGGGGGIFGGPNGR
ncbi:hypothetical protein SAMN05216483_3212 [Streptomyces sp. 2131.1]|nr:hypothetical protein SAMN05216483_3212 [Streptomyces sp. 2131.1]